VVDWAVTHDVFYVCNIPIDVDLTDVSTVSTSEAFVNLLTGYKTVSFEKLALYQELINTFCVEVDVESSTWLLQVLIQSTESSLLVQVKQTYDTLPDAQKGGLTLFKLLVDRIDHRSFESTQALLNFLTGFQLSNFDGENVPLATARFKAVVRLLPTAAIPPNLLEYFLNGMAVCASDDFKDACKSQLGFISNPIYSDWAGIFSLNWTALLPHLRQSMRPCLPSRSGTAPSRRLVISRLTIVVLHPPLVNINFLHIVNGLFTSLVPPAARIILLGPMASRTPWRRKSVTSSNSRHPSSPASKTKFSATVHQALLACCDGDLIECDLYAHLAQDGTSMDIAHDDSPSSSANTAPLSQDASDTITTDVNLEISALLAEGLGNLLLN